MTDMPSSYETSHQTTTTSGTSTGDIRFRIDYIKTIPGILKIVEIVVSIITFICASVDAWFTHLGGGWVQFVSITAFLTVLVWFIFYLFGIIYRLPGPLVLIVVSLITFICACVSWWGGAQDWVQFVSISAFLSTLVYLILHVINLISRFPGPWLLIELIYYCIFTLFFLIAAIVAAARGYIPSAGAAAFFAFVATAVFAVDTFFQFRAWRTGQTEMTTTTTTTTHTTTTASATHVETKEAY